MLQELSQEPPSCTRDEYAKALTLEGAANLCGDLLPLLLLQKRTREPIPLLKAAAMAGDAVLLRMFVCAQKGGGA